MDKLGYSVCTSVGRVCLSAEYTVYDLRLSASDRMLRAEIEDGSSSSSEIAVLLPQQVYEGGMVARNGRLNRKLARTIATATYEPSHLYLPSNRDSNTTR